MWKKAESYLSRDAIIGPLVKKYGKCRILPSKKSEYFENLASSIIEQQLSVKAASTIYQRFKIAVGEVNPESVLQKRDLTLRKCGLSYPKVSYVKDLAAKVKSGEVKLEKLNQLTDMEVIEELTSVKGVGRWTSEMFLMFSLARPDVFPVDDLGIKNGLKILLNNNQFEKTLLSRGDRWSPYRTVASWYIWKSIDS
jgi:DNA-3-methyladenine glycosylase II